MAEQLRPGDPAVIGPYKVVRHLGSGGMGSVYLARSPGQRLVAIKVIHPHLAHDIEFRERFRREANAARRVNGFFTAQVVDADPDATMPWLATAYIEGPSLEAAIRDRGPLPAAELPSLAAGLAEALEAIHAAGLVHRDLKPANVLLAPDGPRVIDFGISQGGGGGQLTSTGEVIGTPAYMSPEQVEGGKVTQATDIFALGCVLTYAATGAGPFSQGGAQTIALQIVRIVEGTPDLAGVPRTIRPLVAACLEKNPANRPTAAQVLNALQALPEYGQHAVEMGAQPQAQARPAGNADPFTARDATAGPMAAPAPPEASPTPLWDPPIPGEPGKPRHHGFASGLAAWFNRVPRRPSPDVESESPAADGDAAVPGPSGPGREWWNEPPASATPAEPSAPLSEWWNRPPANATPPEPERVLEPRAQVVDPASINSRDAFCAALDEVRERANMSTRDVAIASGLLLDTVRGYFVRGRLPAERDVLRQILRVCGVPEEDLPGWDEALLRVRQRPRATPPAAPQAPPRAPDGHADERVSVLKPQRARVSSSAFANNAFGPNADEADLLFHVYIPKTELYAEQRRETLRHFREYLTKVEGQDIRQEDFSGQNGETISFYVAPGQPLPPLDEKIQEFANFVDHCAHSPDTAITHLTRIGLPKQSSATVVTSYAKRFHRMEMDLRHERTNRINALEQQLESELLDKGGDPHGIATLRMSIRSALERAVPPPTAAVAMPSLGPDRVLLDTGPSAIGQPPTEPGTGRTIQGIVRASAGAEAVARDQRVYSPDPTVPTIVYNRAISSVQATDQFGPEARRLLGLIERYGDEENGPLRSALHEIEDPGIPAKTKSAASRLLTAFLADLASKIPDIGTDALTLYLEARPGPAGS